MVKFSILNANICTTYRQDYCEEIPEYKEKDIRKIRPYKSKNRIQKIFDQFLLFRRNELDKENIPIFTIQEMRWYNLSRFKSFFETIDYELYNFHTYPSYPDPKLHILKIDKNDKSKKAVKMRKLKRFSFIHGIALPKNLEVDKKYCMFLANNHFEFDQNKPNNYWGSSGSRIICGVRIKFDHNLELKLFTTQFGMDIEERIRSARMIRNLFKYDDSNIIFTGDFNTFSNLDEMDLKAKEQLELIESAFENVSKNATNQYGAPVDGTFIGMRPVENEKYCIDLSTGSMRSWLDHIFMKSKRQSGLKCSKCSVIVPNNVVFPYSDHCMLQAEFSLNKIEKDQYIF